jgi:hypothetical protein
MRFTRIDQIQPGDDRLNLIVKVFYFIYFRFFKLNLFKEKHQTSDV